MLVVDDHDLVRLGLRTLLQFHTPDNCREISVFEARTLQQALSEYRTHQAAIGLVLLDLHLPDAHGLSGLTTFIAHFPTARVVVLSADNDPALVRLALTAGASAYLAKSGDLHNVIGFIRSLGLLKESGIQEVCESSRQALLSDAALHTTRTICTNSGERLPLTVRQAEVLDWILAGQSNRQIASLADLSEGTVKNHVSTLLLMFNARSRAQLISQLR